MARILYCKAFPQWRGQPGLPPAPMMIHWTTGSRYVWPQEKHAKPSELPAQKMSRVGTSISVTLDLHERHGWENKGKHQLCLEGENEVICHSPFGVEGMCLCVLCVCVCMHACVLTFMCCSSNFHSHTIHTPYWLTQDSKSAPYFPLGKYLCNSRQIILQQWILSHEVANPVH